MKNPHYRYFIELQSPEGEPVPRLREAETRRAVAKGFIASMQKWLEEKNLGEKVSALGVTMFGQIQITCDSAIIKLLREQEDVDIVAIRHGATQMEGFARWTQAH